MFLVLEVHRISMTIAEIHGKPIKNGFEDLLTSNVFSAFSYLPADEGILGYLLTIDGLNERIPSTYNHVSCFG